MLPPWDPLRAPILSVLQIPKASRFLMFGKVADYSENTCVFYQKLRMIFDVILP